MIFIIIQKLGVKVGLQKHKPPHLTAFLCNSPLRKWRRFRAIQMMLGHESITTTKFIRMDTSFLVKTMARFHPRIAAD